MFLGALIEGTLFLDERGCLRVREPDEGALLIIRHHDFSPRVVGETIDVLDGAGKVVGRVGEPFRAGGGKGSPSDRPEACPGSYWILGGIESLEAQAIPDIFIDPFSVGESIWALVAQQSRPAPGEGVISGTLTVDEQKCLRVAEYAVLWPPDVWPRDNAGTFYFVTVDEGQQQTVAVVGEAVQLTGAERQPGDYRYFENKMHCEGPYWGVATVQPVEVQDEVGE